MKKALTKRSGDEMRPEYDLSLLEGGIRGKYYQEATAGTNLVLIDPELASLFPDSESVNRALRVIAGKADSASGGTRQGRQAPKKRLKRSA